MRIRALSTMAGPSGSAQAGDIIDRPEAEARALIAGGHAVAITQTKVERAVVSAPETAEAPANKPAAPADHQADILRAADTLNPENRDHFTSDGRPQVKALESVLGYDITADERDRAWASRPKAD